MAAESCGSASLRSPKRQHRLPERPGPAREVDRSRTTALDSRPVKKQSRWRLRSKEILFLVDGLPDEVGCSSDRVCGRRVAPGNRRRSALILRLSDSNPRPSPTPYDVYNYCEMTIHTRTRGATQQLVPQFVETHYQSNHLNLARRSSSCVKASSTS